ncbi:related to HOL1, putative substrate-H+ antiporter [Phialocephala subalpina]|uniref:Related to HOL1, putative substrate-H+ antiporter n=1 Tax=Phialocephala subalpina TaxID=576137 RepID=A0A1L7WKJ8_9HELO|nr:related to HOL1, putative substrate-H+ antiporter [Phialocephala subalpina]
MDQNLDERALRELEQELHTEIYPGTEIMTDVGTHHFVKAGGGQHSVLVPQPSDDEHDPLNWSPMWKASAMICATLVSFSQGFGPLALAPMFGDYIEEFHSNLTDVIQFTGVAILVLGFSNFIWVPIQTCFGRRPVLILSTLICFGSSIWRAKANSYNSFMGACVLNGIGAGPAETAQPTIIADVIFLHDRGKYQTLYFAFYFGSLMVGPIISGPMAQNVGWRNFWWLNTALLGFTVICCIFLFPETKFNRSFIPQNSIVSGSPPLKGSTEEVEMSAAQNHTSTIATDHADPEKTAPVQPQKSNIAENGLAHIHTHDDPWLGRGKPSKAQWKLFQPYEGNFFMELFLPWKLFLFPIVEFSSFVVSWSASSFLTLNLTQSQVFAAPPYNYNSTVIGFFNFAVLVGAAIGLFTAGPLSDAIAARLTKRNRGIREPEMRLLAMIPYVIVMIIGNVVVAVGYEHHWDWKVIVIIGYTCAGIQVAALPSISSTYSIDSYKPVAGSIFVAITVNKNVWGYGFSKFITPWTIKSGYIPPIMTNMSLITLWCLTGIIFWYFGKTFRKWTKNSKVHSM